MHATRESEAARGATTLEATSEGGDEVVAREGCADVGSHEVLRGLEEAEPPGEAAVYPRDRPRVVWDVGLRGGGVAVGRRAVTVHLNNPRAEDAGVNIASKELPDRGDAEVVT